MKILNQLFTILYVICFSTGVAKAQTITVLDETLLTQESFSTFTTVSISGDQVWNFNQYYGAVCTGYSGGQSYENEDWFISPSIDLSQVNNAQLTFSHTRGNEPVMNVGVAEGRYKVFATAYYTGNPATTNWEELDGLNQNVTTAWQYISSGALTIPETAKSENSRIAFRYISDAVQSATWEIKNVKVRGESQIINPGTAGVFKITNWNTEWLGCPVNGPEDETLQMENVASAMLAMDADIYCIQEVSNTDSSPSISTLVSLLGSSQWGGTIAPSFTGNCNQRQGLIYKKSKVQVVSSSELNTGAPSLGNSYYYNWSSGRYPAVYNVNLISGDAVIPVSLVNIHAKAEDGNYTSYIRRTGASESLKTILDGANYNSKNVIIIGDFNDYLTGTTSTACECTVSPYQNFMDDQQYTGITQDIIDVNTRWGTHPLIENIIISDELVNNYVDNTAIQEVSVSRNISNFYNTTSNHLPVSATFQFSTLSNSDSMTYTGNSLKLTPNPVKEQLKITSSDSVNNATIEIYDLTGRQIYHVKVDNNFIDVSALPCGVYILKAGNKTGKFIKQ